MGETERTTLFPAEVVAPAARRKCARRANDLDGKRWQRNSISIWSDVDKSPAERRLKHADLYSLGLDQILQLMPPEFQRPKRSVRQKNAIWDN
jgi:hypothetical protein